MSLTLFFICLAVRLRSSVFDEKYVGALQARDVAQLNQTNAKGKPQSSLRLLLRSSVFFPVLALDLLFPYVENLSQVSSDRDSSSTRVAGLEAQVLSLREEVDKEKKETAAALTRAKRAESKEEAASKKVEELTPRVQALVNSLSSECSNFSRLLNSLIACQC